MAPKPDREIIYEGSMAAFSKMAAAVLALEIPLILTALYKASTIPAVGDLTLRYISVGVPAFWAVVLPLVVGVLYLTNHGQSVTINNKAFIYRRGTFTCIINWHEALHTPPNDSRFDRQFLVSSRNGQVVIRSLFFPQFDDINREVERSLSNRNSTDYRL